MAEVSPLCQRDEDVADPATEVEDLVLRRDVGRVQDAPVRGVDHPEPAPGEDVAHTNPPQTTAEPFAVVVANGGLVDVPGVTAHSPTLPVARPPRRPPQSRPICPAATTMDGPDNSDRPRRRSPRRRRWEGRRSTFDHDRRSERWRSPCRSTAGRRRPSPPPVFPASPPGSAA